MQDQRTLNLQDHASGSTLYEDVAAHLAGLIDGGTFQVGDRLPSVRQLCRQRQVSVSTVMEAYRLLEDQGRVEVRPQSGHYVCAYAQTLPGEPARSQPASHPTTISHGELMLRILRDAEDPTLVPFGAALPDTALLPTEKLHRAYMTAARREGDVLARYSVPPGCLPLRAQIARRLLATGCSLPPEQIVVTSGCQEALTLALRATCRPGDTVVVDSPTYFNILQLLETLGLRALELPSDPREGLCLPPLQDALREHSVRACLVQSNFSNPLGGSMPSEKKRELVTMLARHDIPLIEDDIFGDLYFDSERPDVAKAYDRKGLVLLCSSYTKTLSPGYRIGWIAAGQFQAEVERLKFASTVATATPLQYAVAEFLANGGYDHHLRSVRRVYSQRIAAMAQAVGRCFPIGTLVSRPQGGFVLWVECPPTIDTMILTALALEEGISIAPGPIFTAQQRYRNCLRLNAAYYSESTAPALQTLGRLAASLLL
jgi:DNA-binding transcriptional MocR family regulator